VIQYRNTVALVDFQKITAASTLDFYNFFSKITGALDPQ